MILTPEDPILSGVNALIRAHPPSSHFDPPSQWQQKTFVQHERARGEWDENAVRFLNSDVVAKRGFATQDDFPWLEAYRQSLGDLLDNLPWWDKQYIDWLKVVNMVKVAVAQVLSECLTALLCFMLILSRRES